MEKKYRSLPNFKFENNAVRKGYAEVIGIDEVGRGAWAGPVVAAATIINNDQLIIINEKPQRWEEIGIDDSKRLQPKKREKLGKIIKKNAAWGIGEVGVAFINKYGIVKATEKAMRAAIAALNLKFQDKKHFVLVDAFHIKYIPGIGLKNQKAIIKGDQRSVSIAAASIMAKVHRDRLMEKLSKSKFKRYGWERNKGYGTKEHQEAILKFGQTRMHRKLFLRKLTG